MTKPDSSWASVRPYASNRIGARTCTSIQKRDNTVEYIDRMESLTGNNSVDFVILKDGRVLGIDAESVVLYASMDDFHGYATVDRPNIDLVA